MKAQPPVSHDSQVRYLLLQLALLLLMCQARNGQKPRSTRIATLGKEKRKANHITFPDSKLLLYNMPVLGKEGRVLFKSEFLTF